MTGPVIIMAGVVVLAIIVFFAVRIFKADLSKTGLDRAQQEALLKDIEERGIAAEAEIKSSTYGGVDRTTPSVAMFQLELEVRPPAGEAYIIDKNICWLTLPNLFHIENIYADRLKKVGRIVPIRIHPDNKMAIAFDVERFEEE